MNAVLIENILARLVDGQAGDDELLACARWALSDDRRRERFRAEWPTDKLPVIGDYFCVASLGQGASGVVFKALACRGEPRLVALKLLRFASGETEGRFREREIEILKALNCPQVARYYDSGTSGGTTYLAMELVQGRPLDEYLAERANRFEDKLAVFQRVCEVVAGLHAEGVIHRDLKPKHVLIDEQSQPWIVDFGISAVRSEDWPTRVRRAQTELGHILGTVKYMSPEQAWGGLLGVDQRADIWSLGIMLYEIATGGAYPYELEPPDDMTRHEALLHRIQTEVPKKPRIAAPQYSDALVTLISRCLAHEASRRLDSADTLAGDLGRCLAGQSIQTRRLPLAYRLKRIAIGLAAHWRVGLWASTVGAILLFLFAVSFVAGVRVEVAGEDYGRDTQRFLAAAAGALGPDGIVIVGVTDNSLRVVPKLAASNSISGVTRDIRSWRAVHGWLMQRLAAAEPRAVVWDFFFRTPQPGDTEFVRGVQALQQAAVPVALAAQEYDDNGRPELSPRLFDPLADTVVHGIIKARDMVARPGEMVLAVRRGDQVYPALILATFAAVVHPGYRTVIDWPDSANTLRLVYHPRASGDELPAVDRVGLTTVYTTNHVRSATRGLRAGDVLGCKTFTLERLANWERRTLPYESLLKVSQAELADRLRDKIVLFGDLRAAGLLSRHDRHRVRYGTEIVDDVPGCYLMADALSGLFANRYLRPSGLLPKRALRAEDPRYVVYAFVVVAVCAFLACLVPPKLATAKWFGSPRVQAGTLSVLSAGWIACTLALVVTRNWHGAQVAMFGTAVCAALAVSFAIEFARNRYRVPPTV